MLEREGLVRQVPRKGVIVTPLTLHDIYEICTLRAEFETLAVRLGVPVREAARMRRCRQALQRMGEAAEIGDQAAFLEFSFAFHVAVVGLSGHQRLEEAYRSLQLQLMLSMALNRKARQDREGLGQDVARHQRLLETIDAGDPEAVLAELAVHGDRTFLEGIETRVDGHTEEALQWLRRQRQAQEDT